MRSLLIELTLLISLTLIVYFLQPSAMQYLAFYHTGLQELEFWRLITATFCHTNFNHLLMNISGLLVCVFLFIDTFKKVRLIPMIIFNSAFISVMIFYFDPNTLWYVGFSGVLHGLFSFGVCSDITKKDRWGYLLGLCIFAKISYEQVYGANAMTIELINAPVLTNAHLYGALAGIAFFILQNISVLKALSTR
ncbi:rhomboid family protein [Psychromonas sp. CNPT3]|uniref:rhombosortase n=1 Tax=Psychromonas sp. CNPT3 TaxID=314282 RepID=UPI00006E34A4|nr:rhombosortase [Psychromonas sp. CNPT3]AGH80579.1 rhomboid family protein [Psychromonas sp. CNPT3]